MCIRDSFYCSQPQLFGFGWTGRCPVAWNPLVEPIVWINLAKTRSRLDRHGWRSEIIYAKGEFWKDWTVFKHHQWLADCEWWCRRCAWILNIEYTSGEVEGDSDLIEWWRSVAAVFLLWGISLWWEWFYLRNIFFGNCFFKEYLELGITSLGNILQ